MVLCFGVLKDGTRRCGGGLMFYLLFAGHQESTRAPRPHNVTKHPLSVASRSSHGHVTEQQTPQRHPGTRNRECALNIRPQDRPTNAKHQAPCNDQDSNGEVNRSPMPSLLEIQPPPQGPVPHATPRVARTRAWGSWLKTVLCISETHCGFLK